MNIELGDRQKMNQSNSPRSLFSLFLGTFSLLDLLKFCSINKHQPKQYRPNNLTWLQFTFKSPKCESANLKIYNLCMFGLPNLAS